MGEYHVVWEIDVEADDPREAAEKSREIQRNMNDSWAGVFRVWDQTGEVVDVDLDAEQDEDEGDDRCRSCGRVRCASWCSGA